MNGLTCIFILGIFFAFFGFLFFNLKIKSIAYFTSILSIVFLITGTISFVREFSPIATLLENQKASYFEEKTITIWGADEHYVIAEVIELQNNGDKKSCWVKIEKKDITSGWSDDLVGQKVKIESDYSDTSLRIRTY